MYGVMTVTQLAYTLLTQGQMFILIGGPRNNLTVPVRDDENDKTIVWPTAGSLTEHYNQVVFALFGGHGLYGHLWLVSHLHFSRVASVQN